MFVFQQGMDFLIPTWGRVNTLFGDAKFWVSSLFINIVGDHEGLIWWSWVICTGYDRHCLTSWAWSWSSVALAPVFMLPFARRSSAEYCFWPESCDPSTVVSFEQAWESWRSIWSMKIYLNPARLSLRTDFCKSCCLDKSRVLPLQLVQLNNKYYNKKNGWHAFLQVNNEITISTLTEQR